jgi:hypothetical protein
MKKPQNIPEEAQKRVAVVALQIVGNLRAMGQEKSSGRNTGHDRAISRGAPGDG